MTNSLVTGGPAERNAVLAPSVEATGSPVMWSSPSLQKNLPFEKSNTHAKFTYKCASIGAIFVSNKSVADGRTKTTQHILFPIDGTSEVGIATSPPVVPPPALIENPSSSAAFLNSPPSRKKEHPPLHKSREDASILHIG